MQQEDEDTKNFFEVPVTENIEISIEQLSCSYENHTCKKRDELHKQMEEDWRIIEIKEEPCQSSEENIDDNNTSSLCNYDVPKNEYIKDEPHHGSQDVSVKNDTGDEHDEPLITLASTSGEGGEQSNPYINSNEAVLTKILQRTSSKEESNVSVLSCKEVNKQNITGQIKNKCKVNATSSKKRKLNNAYEISKQSNVDTIWSGDKALSCDVAQEKSLCRSQYIGALPSNLRHADEKSFSCNICSYKCKQINTIQRHLITHTGKNLFACDICSFKSKTKCSLKQHLSTHTGEKPFSCDICSYKSRRKGNLINHLSTHIDEKPISCDICSYKCRRKDKLKLHLITHTDEKPFSCDICSFKCKNKRNLKRHQTMHTDEKPFSCVICSFKCKYKRNLKRHLRTHTGEIPFSCDICSFKCKSKRNFNQHLSTHTGEILF